MLQKCGFLKYFYDMIININNPRSIELVSELIRKDEVVALPTETVYGLVTNSTSESAIRKIYEIKKRPGNMALQVLVGSHEQAYEMGEFNIQAIKLAEKFWPGPLTIVVRRKKSKLVDPFVSAGKDTIGIRFPDYDFVLKVIKNLGNPLIASSANISGGANPLNAEDVHKNFGDMIPLIIDGGKVRDGLPSTVIDASTSEIKILRHGAIKEADIVSAVEK